MPLKVVHTVGSLGVAAGGPSRTVPALCEHVQMANNGLEVHLLTTTSNRFGPSVSFVDVPLRTIEGNASLTKLKHFVRQCVLDAKSVPLQENAILHDHGQWLPLNRASAAIARRLKLKRVVSPRGMLTPWALGNHRWKKRLAWLAFARRDFEQASLLHATSQLEADELRHLGARQPIAVIPNGVDLHTLSADIVKSKNVLFLSRIHLKKGITELVDAWRVIHPPGWNLLLAGPDEGDLVQRLALSEDDNIAYIGQVEGEAKQQLFECASVFVLPSYSENFGVVVAEALMAGTPVITTHGTPWNGLVDNGCGWWVPMDHDSLVQALRQATSLDLGTLAEMGQLGRQYVCRSFTWPAIGRQMADVYRWLIGQGSVPDCVQFA